MKTIGLRRWSRNEYEAMIAAGLFAPGERVELIDGEILTVTPQGSLHATAVRLAEDALRVSFGPGFDARAGIRDYWILNLGSRCLEVYRNPDKASYRSTSSLPAGESISPVAAPGAKIAVSDILP